MNKLIWFIGTIFVMAFLAVTTDHELVEQARYEGTLSMLYTMPLGLLMLLGMFGLAEKRRR